MAKRKYRIGLDEAQIATLLRDNPDRWFTDNDVTQTLDVVPHYHLNRLAQLRVVDVIRNFPDHIFRWSPEAQRNNPQYVHKLDDVTRLWPGHSVLVASTDPEDERSVPVEGLSVVEESVVVEPDPTPVEQEPELIVEDDIVVTEEDGEREYTARELAAIAEYEKKYRLATKRGKDGRFIKGNPVFHPKFGQGIVLTQMGKKQLKVRFARSRGGDLVVMDEDVIFDDRSIEELKCVICGTSFPRLAKFGKRPLYCSDRCKADRNARVKAERRAREKEAKRLEAEAEAQRQAAALLPEVTEESIEESIGAFTVVEQAVATATSSPQILHGSHGTYVAIVLRQGPTQPTTANFLSVEDAIEFLMDRLPK